MEELSEDVRLAKDIVEGIRKGKKLLKMYPQNNPIYIKTFEGIYSKFESFFELYNEIPLQIHQNEISFNNEQIYYSQEKENNLALFFFKDGIREITFLKGFTREECEDFIKILNTDFENIALDDDIVTLLWEQDFEYIKYVVDEDALSDEEEEEKNRMTEEIKNKLHSDDDLLRAYHDGLKAPEQKVDSLVPISEDDFKHIVKEIEKEETYSNIERVTTILFELLYQTRERRFFAETVGFIENVIIYCIKNGDFKNTTYIINSIKSIIKAGDAADEKIKTIKKILVSINSKTSINGISRIIDGDATIEEGDFKVFVKHLDKTSIPHFMKLIGQLQSIRGRRLIIEVLSIIGSLDIETIAKGLNDRQWYVVRNIISILGRIADVRAIGYLTKTLSHPDQRVRKETVKTMGGIGGPNIMPYLKQALNDKDSSVRMPVIRILGNTRTTAAKKILLTELSKRSFQSKEFSEKKEFYGAIANWKDQDVKDFLLEKLRKKRFWNRAKNDETRACAAYAVGIVGYMEAIPFLEKTQNSRNKLLRTLSHTAIKQLTA
ncbi:MAG: HEAT repeat domain-containing protein [Candidatus Mariimomonas ferrooxydans]